MPANTTAHGQTPRELSRQLRVGVKRLLGWIRQGELAAINVADPGRRPRYIILPDQLASFLRRREVQPARPAPRRRKRSTPVDYYPD
jgi:hypothetical protein